MNSNDTIIGSLCPSDFSFGPAIDGCARTFDFSVTFEESILSIAPSVLLLLLAPVRLVSLRKRPSRVGGKLFQKSKLVAILVFAAVQLSLLVLWSTQLRWQTKTSVAAAALSFLDMPIFGLLSYFEHSKSIRPSAILGVYLFFSVIFDAVRLRTMWLLEYNSQIRALFTASFALKTILFMLEAQEKRRYLSASDRRRGPEETSGVISQSLFWWLNKLIRRGFKNVLSLGDLYPIDEEMSSELQASRFEQHWAKSIPGKYRLMKVVYKMFTWQTLYPVLPRIVLVAFTFCQPLLLNRFLQWLQTPSESPDIGYGLIGAYGFVYFGLAIFTGFYWHGVFRWIALIRGTLISAIYHKTTEISITALDNSAAVTLMSADVERIVDGLRDIHELWANAVQVSLATWMLERELGLACIAPVLVALASASGTIWTSANAGRYQVKWVKEIQKRVGITATMLGSMKGVKMSGLTDMLTKHIQQLRIDELVAGTQFRMMQIYTAVIAFVPIQLSPVITFGVFIAISDAAGQKLDTTRMFTSLSLLQLLAQPLSQIFQSLSSIIGAIGCAERIETFLSAESRADHRLLDLSETTSIVSLPSPTGGRMSKLPAHDNVELVNIKVPRKPSSSNEVDNNNVQDVIRVRDGAFGWKGGEAPILKNINFNISRGSLTIVVGPVAAGKTTLLKALLGETPSSKGFVHISTTDFAFCDQTPWLLSQSIQKNVIGFAPLDSAWYDTAIHCSCLADDIATFPGKDDTMIGSNGISLSGGQKSRLAIARAVYARKKVAIFDDVFSGLDKTTEKRVFERLFGQNGVMRRLRTTVIIATHAVDIVPYADLIIAMGINGEIVEQGSFAELNAKEGYVQSFALKARNADEDEDVQELETSVRPTTEFKEDNTTARQTEDKARQMGDMSVYRHYFRAVGSRLTLIFFGAAMSFAFFQTWTSVWLKFWSDAVNSGDNNNTKWLVPFAVFQVMGLSSLLCLGVASFNYMTVSAGLKLHLTTLKTVMTAPLLFFSSTDTGETLNRFSQDFELIDTELPQAMLNFVSLVLSALGQAILIATASAYIAIIYPAIILVFFLVQKFYLRTSRQLRFMDIEAKSPLYTQFLESLNGLATLRAFGWQKSNIQLNHKLLDDSQKPFYLLFMIQRWLTMVMDLIGMGLALVVVGVAVTMRGSISPGFAGVSLVNIISVTETLKYVVLTWTLLETSIGAVSRVRSFESTLKSEDLPEEINEPATEWPSRGLLEFENVSATYKPGGTTVLHNINLTIQPGEKIGICGPSGSGKSSLLLALFRMLPQTTGTITLDGHALDTLPRRRIRKSINAIPQEAYFLSGTIRSNLDPTYTNPDSSLLEVLAKVHLLDTITALGGLGAELAVDDLSHGQRQLFCLGRAILRRSEMHAGSGAGSRAGSGAGVGKGGLIILDECTSNVDRQTDSLMQAIIREEFAGCTIVAVAHRLETILDFDRVLVLERGVVVEVGRPEDLLSEEWSGGTDGEVSAFKKLFDTYRGGGSSSASASGHGGNENGIGKESSTSEIANESANSASN